MHTTISTSTVSGPPDEDQQYARFLGTIRERFEAATKGGRPLFLASPGASDSPLFGSLYDTFLSGLPAPRRQHYDCNACRRFVEKYGRLAFVQEGSNHGTLDSALWDPSTAPPFFRNAVIRLCNAVYGAKVAGVFYDGEKTWGTPKNRQTLNMEEHGRTDVLTWHHMHVLPGERAFKRALLSTFQASAEKTQDFEMLSRALHDFDHGVLLTAKALLADDALYRSEKVLGVATWLVDLSNTLIATKSRTVAHNLTWLAVATAPAGFCHVRSTMIGTLLEDLAANKPFEDVKRAFAAKMHPAAYQRPQVAPSAGNIAQAEKIVSQLKSEGALARRYATLADVLPHALWKPPTKSAPPNPGGVFGHLLPKRDRGPVDNPAPPAVMTWAKFRSTILQAAEAIECFTPDLRGPFFAMVTAVDPGSTPMLQWDLEDDRNPMSWYFHLNGAYAMDFGLPRRQYVNVDAVCLQPNQWTGTGFPHHGEGAYFILRGCRDGHAQNAGFFVENLRSEYHAIKKTLEAHVRSTPLAGYETATACGIAIQKGNKSTPEPLQLRVTAGGVRSVYKLDRWD